MNLLNALLLRRLAGSGAAEQTEALCQVNGTSPSIAAADKTLYLCTQPLSSLTLSSLPASGLFELVFAAGDSAPEVILPDNVLLPPEIRIRSSAVYDLSVRVCAPGGHAVGLAALGAWPLPESEEDGQ